MTITLRPATPDDLPALIAIVDRAAADGEFPGHVLDDVERWRISMREVPARTTIALREGDIAGLLCMETHDLVVAPAHRRRGVGRALVAAAIAERPAMTFYPSGHETPAADFLRALGMVHAHSWYEMHLAPERVVAAVDLPGSYCIRPYRLDEAEAYFALLTGSFADHPTPIEADLDLVLRVQSRPEFDPSLLGMLVDANAPDDLLGFCRCVAVPQPDGSTGGEVRTLGVMPHVRRRGFGRHLLRWGVHRLRDAGCGVVTLGVIASNDKALALYVDEGFVSVGEHPSYAMPAS